MNIHGIVLWKPVLTKVNDVFDTSTPSIFKLKYPVRPCTVAYALKLPLNINVLPATEVYVVVQSGTNEFGVDDPVTA